MPDTTSKNKGGRPRSASPREFAILLRLTEAEDATVREAAHWAGQGVADYLRGLVMRGARADLAARREFESGVKGSTETTRTPPRRSRT